MGGADRMKVLHGAVRTVSDETASFAADRFIGDSALPLSGIRRPAAADGGILQEGKSCRLACLDVLSDELLSGTSFSGKLCILAALDRTSSVETLLPVSLARAAVL